MEKNYLAQNYHPLDVIIERARGVWVYDVYGKKYLDMLAGYSALNLGHCHEKLVEVIKKQVSRLTLTSRAFRNDQLGLFAKEICEFTGFEKVLPMNTGAEAVETALKLARKWGYLKKGIREGKAEIIVFANNFHGRTISIISFSTENLYKKGFGPYTPGFKVVNFDNITALEKAISRSTAAVLMEPIQGEGGIIIPDNCYLKRVSDICRENNVLLMLDEIQTGFGRTGKMFGYQHEEGVKPDVLIVGKALGGGFYPVSAVLADKKVMEVITPGTHGSTFGGNPLACSIARKVLEIFHDENVLENCVTIGEYFINKLKTIKSKWIKEVRGKGLFIGIELTKESGGARKFCEKLAKEGLLCRETHEYVLRLSPALIITKKQIDLALIKLKRILET